MVSRSDNMTAMSVKDRGLSSFALKIIAVVTMLIDHVGYCLFGQVPDAVYQTMRIVGRLAMPIFCFMIVEGVVRTSNFKKYLTRLLIFTALSFVPFRLFSGADFSTIFSFGSNSVMVTLTVGALVCRISKYFAERLSRGAYFAVSLALFVLGGMLCEILDTDYGFYGIMMIASFYYGREKKWLLIVLSAICSLVLYPIICSRPFYNLIQSYCLLALVPILCYNGKRGYSSKFVQYGFYAFYPVHLLLLYLIFHFI